MTALLGLLALAAPRLHAGPEADAFLRQGWALERQKQYGQAASAYEQALEVEPNNPSALLRAATADYYLRDFRASLAHQRRLLRLVKDPRYRAFYQQTLEQQRLQSGRDQAQARQVRLKRDWFNRYSLELDFGVHALGALDDAAAYAPDVVSPPDPGGLSYAIGGAFGVAVWKRLNLKLGYAAGPSRSRSVSFYNGGSDGIHYTENQFELNLGWMQPLYQHLSLGASLSVDDSMLNVVIDHHGPPAPESPILAGSFTDAGFAASLDAEAPMTDAWALLLRVGYLSLSHKLSPTFTVDDSGAFARLGLKLGW